MKKIKLKGKLSLNKETIAKLNDEQMSNVIGGNIISSIRNCTGFLCCDPNYSNDCCTSRDVTSCPITG